MKNSKCFLVIALLYIVLYDFNFIGKIRRFINRRICVHSLFFRFYFYFSKIKENRIDRIILIQFIENNSAIIHWQIIKKYTIEILILDIKVCRFPILLSTFNFFHFSRRKIFKLVIFLRYLILQDFEFNQYDSIENSTI